MLKLYVTNKNHRFPNDFGFIDFNKKWELIRDIPIDIKDRVLDKKNEPVIVLILEIN